MNSLYLEIPHHAANIWDAYVDALLTYDAPDLLEARELVYRWACLCRVQPHFYYDEDHMRTITPTRPTIFIDPRSGGQAMANLESSFRERLPALVNLSLELDGFQVWHEDLQQAPELIDDEEAYAKLVLELFEDLDMAECVIWLARELQLPDERVQPFVQATGRMRRAFVTNTDIFSEVADHAYLTLRCAARRQRYGGTLTKHKYLCYWVNGDFVAHGLPLRYPEYGAPPMSELPEDVRRLLR